MNKRRRKKIVKSIELINMAKSYINTVMLEEQMAFDNTPEHLQDSWKGDKMQGCISQLEDASDDLESALQSLEEAAL